MRVFVTGLGIVSPLGLGARPTMDALMRGERAFRPLELFDASDQRTTWAAEVANLSVADVAPAKDRETWSRTDSMAVVAAREALAQARLDPSDAEVDLAVGGTTGGMFETEHLLAEMVRDPSRQEPLALMLSHPLSATSDRMRASLGPFRRARSICSACSGGANAILVAGAWIRTGRADRVLAGGADGLCRLTFSGFNALGGLALDTCRPFDRRRMGLGRGEGASFLWLASETSARARGPTVLAHLMGKGVKLPVRAALANSFGFGGTDTVLLFVRPGRFEHRSDLSRGRLVVTGAATMGPLGLAGSLRSLEYIEPGSPPDAAALRFEPREHFDLGRARRMDHSARLLTMAMQAALAEANKDGVPPAHTGAIAGSAYGTVDASAEFVQRIYEKGARLASPMVFPNLVPSSPVGHAAIYLGLRGPVLATADLGVTGEAAFALACELIEVGEARAILAGGVEEQSSITERVLGPVCSGSAS